MRCAVIACVLAACSTPPAPQAPLPQHEIRCTLRVSTRGLYVDGERTSRDDAVAHCKRADEGATVVLELDTPQAAWDKTRVALEREGVAIHLQGPLSWPVPVRAAPIPISTLPEREPINAKPEEPVRKAQPPPPPPPVTRP